MNDIVKGLFEFIEASPTCFHNVKTVEDRLLKEGYTKLYETTSWSLTPGKYFTSRDNATIIAFKIGKEANGFNVVASHNDSPTFKLKPNYELNTSKFKRLNTEPYGGMIATTWFDRPLSLAGRVFVKENDKIVSKLVNLKDLNIIIPSVAIHLTRGQTQELTNMQNDLLPVIGLTNENTSLEETIKNVVGNDIIAHDLFLYNKDKSVLGGLDNELIFSPRLDDLECAYISLESFLHSNNEEKVSVCAIFDNEEAGSGSNHGANSTFLTDVLERIATSLNKDIKVMYANSMLVSADNAHAQHPAQPQKSDPTNNVAINEGVVIKYHSGLSYTTEGLSSAIFKSICHQCECKYQDYTNRSDLRGGSTLGNIALSKFSVKSVDIGFAQLAMHSAVETAGTKDLVDMFKVLKAFYNAKITEDNESIIL